MRRHVVRCWVVVPLALSLLHGCRGEAPGPGTIRGKPLPDSVIAQRQDARNKAAAQVAAAAGSPPAEKEILFGDLHVHSNFSADAFLMSLPLMQGKRPHPVAHACDFARYCSGLDFWAITDHAESLTPKRWRETVETLRKCNAVSAGSRPPDLISFLGWEWSQIGLTAGEHYGHRSVILKDLDDGRIPLRPVGASGFAEQVMSDKLPLAARYLLPEADWSNRERYLDFIDYWRETRETEECLPGVDVKNESSGCMDFAKTPAGLFEKLRQWGTDSIVIPTGTTWGINTPPGYFLDRSLRGAQNDDVRQGLIEIFAGHGNSEEYRSWREAKIDPQGRLVCPEPAAGYEPCCWRAGEIIRARCDDPSSPECRSRVEDARRNFLSAGVSGRLTVSGADVTAWNGCGQCLDCFNPSFEYRPGGSVQYALALTDFSDPGHPRRFRFGFIGSSDNHSARPGTGYKEIRRREMTDSFGPSSLFWRRWIRPVGSPAPESEASDPKNSRFRRFQFLDFERGSSFSYTGGLVAVHAERRDRDSVWDAMRRREVYATSGERILLWFDLLREGTPAAPMGASVDWSGTPRFRIRAVGSFEQKPGCPEFVAGGLDSARLQTLCSGECDNPSDKRRAIVRLEVVRIRPQVRPGEPIAGLIEDPWKTLPCSGQEAGCAAEFEDEEYAAGLRDAVYYVRAIQQATPAINADGLRCKRDDAGRCTDVTPCYGDYRTSAGDDCLAPNEERAWSSPIYLTWKAGAAEILSRSPR